MKDMNDRFLKTGIFLAPFHPLRENPLLAIDRDMELLEHLDRLNYTEAWVGEHHSAGFEIINCPEMFIAGAADWGVHQSPGAFERMQRTGCADMRGCWLIPGAGHWVQQEQPQAVVASLTEFLKG